MGVNFVTELIGVLNASTFCEMGRSLFGKIALSCLTKSEILSAAIFKNAFIY